MSVKPYNPPVSNLVTTDDIPLEFQSITSVIGAKRGHQRRF